MVFYRGALIAVLSMAVLATGHLQAQTFEEAKAAFETAMKLRGTGQFVKAAAEMERALQLFRQVEGENAVNTATCMNGLGILYQTLGQYAKAEPLFQRCVEIYETREGKDSLSAATALNGQAAFYYEVGEYARAETIMQRALAIRESRLGKDHPQTAELLNNLANVYWRTGQHGKAEGLMRRTLEICEAKLGKDHPQTATALSNLGGLCHDMGSFSKAEAWLSAALEIREAQLGKDHPDTGATVHNLATLYHNMGQHAKAEQFFLRALAVREAGLGKDHSDVAQTLNNLANLYKTLGQYDKSESLHRRTLEIYEAKFGKDHVLTADSWHNLATLAQDRGQFAQAEAMHLRALAIREAKLGKDHPRVGLTLNNLANLYRDAGDYAKAEPLYRRSLSIRAGRLGKDHPDTAQSLNNLACNHAQQERWQDAVSEFSQARRIETRHVAHVLPSLPGPQQDNFLHKNFSHFHHMALSLGQAQPADPEVATASATWLLNGKGLVHQTLAEQHLLARDVSEIKAMVLIEQLKAARAELARLLQSAPRPGQEQAYQDQQQRLWKNEQDLTRRLAQTVGRPFRDDPWVELEEVRQKLPADGVLIDIARFPVYDFKNKKWQSARYVAWLTPAAGKGQVRIIDLGEAAQIDKAVQQARQAVSDSAREMLKEGEPEAVKRIQQPLADLAKLVLQPLWHDIGGYREWVISPDGALWLVPWAALPMPDGKYAIEKHLIRHVVSGRDLVTESPAVKAEQAWVFADPDYDLTPAEVNAEVQKFLQGHALGTAPALLGKRAKGTIGDWRVSFEFLKDGQLLIRDEEDGGKVAGQGQWAQSGAKLTMQTKLARFQGTISAMKASGQRTLNNQTDAWQFHLPEELTLADELRSAGSALTVLPKAPRLPASAAEAALVEPSLKALFQASPKLLTGGQAAEAVLKAVSRPRLLMLSTHGYFLPDQEREIKNAQEAAPGERSVTLVDKKGTKLENPLLRCGLLLAGCNKRDQAKAHEDDGILSGLEIVGLDLRGCKLAVLSACETGVGEVKNGEGVAGLRQAFMLAGAESVLASLWQVSDRETALLMGDFFSNLSKGQSNAEGLRNAQLKRLEDRRARFGAAHPFFWAAFTVTGK